MSFVEIVIKLHNDSAVMPQFARVCSDTTVQYAFILRGVHDPITGNVRMPSMYEMHRKMTDSFAELLKLQIKHYGISIDVDGVDSRVAFDRKITLSYKPKSEEELASIRNSLEGIPEEEGNLPKKGKDFFCYT